MTFNHSPSDVSQVLQGCWDAVITYLRFWPGCKWFTIIDGGKRGAFGPWWRRRLYYLSTDSWRLAQNNKKDKEGFCFFLLLLLKNFGC